MTTDEINMVCAVMELTKSKVIDHDCIFFGEVSECISSDDEYIVYLNNVRLEFNKSIDAKLAEML